MNRMRYLLDGISLLSRTYKEMEDARGENYNLFRVIDMTSDETSVHSAFLADLLNPKGLHHAGDAFLRLFLEQIHSKIGLDTNTARVEREKYIGPTTEHTGGRLDLFITDSTGKAIIIENKIHASDQENQMERYHNFAESLKGDYELLYLSLDGEVQDEKKTAKALRRNEHYRTISYETDILKWLEQCREKATDKPLVREGIGHYLNLIKQLTHQTLSKEMEKEMQGLILGNPDYIRNIGNLKRAILSSEVTLQRNFWTDLEKAMEAAGHPVIRDETYRYALDDKKNRIEGYYKGMADNRRYGLEFTVGTCCNVEIRYAIRMDEPLICGFFATEGKGAERKISNKYAHLQTLVAGIGNNYRPDKAGYYLGVKNLVPELFFKALPPETLERLVDMSATVAQIAQSASQDIEAMRKVLQDVAR